MKFPEYQHQIIEPQILNYWQEQQIVEKLRKKNQSEEKFYFLEGPPYTSGNIHLGHAWNMALKDIVLRYKRMRGYNVWDRMGYDMHGLPTEQKVMKKFNLRDKEDIQKFGIAKFMKECYLFCTEMMQQMNLDFKRIGATLDFADPYQPITNSFMEAEWLLIKTAHDKGRLYQGLRTMHWDAATQTAAAKHELEYKKIKDTSIYVKFQFYDDSSKYFIIWTTTPWTIPLNLAIMVNPEIGYVEVKVGKEIWVVAEALAESVLAKAKINKYVIKEKHKGKKYLGQKYHHPLEIKPYLPRELQENPKLFTVLPSTEYVDLSTGTGLVHCAPGCGPEDYEVGHLNHLPPFNCVNEAGYFEDFAPFNGWKAKTDDDKFIAAIEKNEAVVATESYWHDYPHGERSHEPVIFRTTKQWFFKVEDLRQKMLKANSQILWNPALAKNAFNSWLENLRDNSITKQRYWGTPVPIWQADDGDYLVVGSLQELEKLSGRSIQKMHIPEIDKIVIKKNGKTYARIHDVLDVWIDAGSVSWNCLNYPAETKHFNQFFPADFILEGKDQIRGWFNLLMVGSMLLFDKPCFKAVYMNGFVTDINGEKMSKSLGNIISPNELIQKHSADVLRYYMSQNSAGEDINFSWEECQVKERQLHILWNLHKLLLSLSTENNINPKNIKPKLLDLEEKYILSKLHSAITEVTAFLENYRIDEIIAPLEELFLELSRTYVQITREKCSSGSLEERKKCIHALYVVLLETIKMFQVVAPFICEAIYLNFKQAYGLPEASISHYPWPQANPKQINNSLEQSFNIVQEIITSSLHAREKIKRGLRWPVLEIIVVTADETVKTAIKSLSNIIKTQTNSKEIIVTTALPKVISTITANLGKIGPIHGSLSPQIAQAVLEKDPEKVLQELQDKNKLEIKIKGKIVYLSKEMLNIQRSVPEGYAEAEFTKGVIYITTKATEALETEGFVRELTRQIQQARKEAGLQKIDRVSMHIQTRLQLKDWLAEIKDKVGARTLNISEQSGKGKHTVKFTIKDQAFNVWFSKE